MSSAATASFVLKTCFAWKLFTTAIFITQSHVHTQHIVHTVQGERRCWQALAEVYIISSAPNGIGAKWPAAATSNCCSQNLLVLASIATVHYSFVQLTTYPCRQVGARTLLHTHCSAVVAAEGNGNSAFIAKQQFSHSECLNSFVVQAFVAVVFAVQVFTMHTKDRNSSRTYEILHYSGRFVVGRSL